jgi:hypothetical protein
MSPRVGLRNPEIQFNLQWFSFSYIKIIFVITDECSVHLTVLTYLSNTLHDQISHLWWVKPWIGFIIFMIFDVVIEEDTLYSFTDTDMSAPVWRTAFARPVYYIPNPETVAPISNEPCDNPTDIVVWERHFSRVCDCVKGINYSTVPFIVSNATRHPIPQVSERVRADVLRQIGI